MINDAIVMQRVRPHAGLSSRDHKPPRGCCEGGGAWPATLAAILGSAGYRGLHNHTHRGDVLSAEAHEVSHLFAQTRSTPRITSYTLMSFQLRNLQGFTVAQLFCEGEDYLMFLSALPVEDDSDSDVCQLQYLTEPRGEDTFVKPLCEFYVAFVSVFCSLLERAMISGHERASWAPL